MRSIITASLGAGHIMIGTDFPFPWTTTPVDLTPGLSNAAKRAILGENAAKLLRIAS